MAYEKQTWDTTSFVNPTRMNHIEDGIEEASNGIGALETEVSELSETMAEFTTEEVAYDRNINGHDSAGIAIPTKEGYTPTFAVLIQDESADVNTIIVTQPLFRKSRNTWQVTLFNVYSQTSKSSGIIKVYYLKNK